MPLRDLALALIVFGSLPFVLARPWIGILMWSWIGYMSPHRLTFGFAFNFPWAYLIAVVTLAGLVLTHDRARLPRTREVWLLIAFWSWMTLTTLFANYPEEAWDQWDKVSKIFLMIIVSFFIMQEPVRVKLLLWVMALSIGFYGFKGGIFGLRSGGESSKVLGPEGSFIAGNTEVGLAFTMMLPIIAYLRHEAPHPWIRHFLTATFALTVIATIFTYSRGAFLALAVVLFILLIKSRRRILLAVVLAASAYALLAIVPDDWVRRTSTIATYDQDNSALGRLHAWRVALAVAADSPVLGGGFRTFSPEIFAQYGFPGGRDAHSIYFQVLGEHGYVGLGLYLGLIGATLLSLRQLGRKPQADPSRRWIPECARKVAASLVAYLVGGAFLSMSYFDLFYGLVQVTVLLRALDARPVSPPAPRPVPRPVPARALRRH